MLLQEGCIFRRNSRECGNDVVVMRIRIDYSIYYAARSSPSNGEGHSDNLHAHEVLTYTLMRTTHACSFYVGKTSHFTQE